jgi:hypothetical protein
MSSRRASGRPATIQDIAERCGVSTAVVSAALRGAGGSVRYSEATGKRVQRAAAELHYAPNRLAQAIRTGTVPVVGVSLHTPRLDRTAINTYLHDTLPAAGVRLHELGMEMLFLPYTSHDEQVRRLRSRIAGRLIGGVVSNFIAPDGDAKLVSFLREAGIPFVLIGDVEDAAVPSLASDDRAIRDVLNRYAASRRLRRLMWVRGVDAGGTALLAARDSKGRVAFPLDAQAIRNCADVLFVAQGADPLRLATEQKLVPAEHLVLVEDARLWRGRCPAVLVQSQIGRKAEMAVDIAVRWMRSGQPPHRGRVTVALTEGDVVLKTADAEKT